MLAVVALFHFIYVWNDFLGPLIFVTRRENFTLARASALPEQGRPHAVEPPHGGEHAGRAPRCWRCSCCAADLCGEWVGAEGVK